MLFSLHQGAKSKISDSPKNARCALEHWMVYGAPVEGVEFIPINQGDPKKTAQVGSHLSKEAKL